MNKLSTFLFIVISFLFAACQKETVMTSQDAILQTTVDTLHFDTLFTTVRSVTKSFTLINNNSGKLKISSIQLAGGNNSPFKINVNGIPGNSFSNIELDANDSLYVFVNITVDPTNANTPFVILDSLLIKYNGNNKIIYLQAYGQNATFINTDTITVDTTWTNDLPIVIQHSLSIAKGVTLTIEKGTKIYVNAKAGFIVNGTLICNGDKDEVNRITFKSDRLDEAYRDLPAGWPGIVFTPTSSGNHLTYTNILNAYQALVAEGGTNNTTPLLTLDECNISNAYDIGLYAVNTSVKATNCLISQCGNDAEAGVGGSNVLITGGGNYDFNHCTIATYSNAYQTHKQPVVYISNQSGTITAALHANFTNCIIYGEGSTSDELAVLKNANDIAAFSNCIYKVKDNDPSATFTDCLKNEAPLFDSINTFSQLYNFRLKNLSPAVDAGKTTATSMDLDGLQRPVGTKPDIGCYERQ